MQAGFALLEAGSVQKAVVVNILFKVPFGGTSTFDRLGRRRGGTLLWSARLLKSVARSHSDLAVP